jgi:hypothetical protein
MDLTVGAQCRRQKPKPAHSTALRQTPHSRPMPDTPETPRKLYKFKATEFENVNGVRRDSPLHETQPPPDPGIVPTEKVRIDVRDLARAAAIPSATARPAPPQGDNEVHTMLRENLARANATGLNHVALPAKRSSRRTRDYVIALILGNALLAIATVISPIFGAAGLIIYNLGLTWIMWFVMDAY